MIGRFLCRVGAHKWGKWELRDCEDHCVTSFGSVTVLSHGHGYAECKRCGKGTR